MIEIEGKFRELEGRKDTLIKQRGTIDKKLTEITQEQLRLDGEYTGLKALKDGEDAPKAN
jgi:hypothetical protein